MLVELGPEDQGMVVLYSALRCQRRGASGSVDKVRSPRLLGG